MRALEGLRVLDLTRLLPGALATQYLADAGADVIKIEQPGTGDYARTLFTPGGTNPVFTATNRGKRSIVLDLKHPRGKELLLALVKKSDVLVESFRPGVMDRLGLGWSILHEANPRLIYAALTGYGQQGPMRDAAGHDINYMAVSGALGLIGVRSGEPVVPNVQIADVAGGGMQTAMAVLLALAARERSGEGQFADVSMTHGAAKLLAIPLAHYTTTREEPGRGEGILSGEYACYGVYRCRDRHWIAVGALEPKFWEALCRAIGCPDLIGDHYAHPSRQRQIRGQLAGVFAQRDAADWLAQLAPHDCCVTLVRTVGEAVADPWLGLTAPPGRAPGLGEHTREVLLEAGIPVAGIDQAFAEGVIA